MATVIKIGPICQFWLLEDEMGVDLGNHHWQLENQVQKVAQMVTRNFLTVYKSATSAQISMVRETLPLFLLLELQKNISSKLSR